MQINSKRKKANRRRGALPPACSEPPGERIKLTFVVQMWWEPDAGSNGGEWRGFVEHIGTKEKRYFRDPKIVHQFVGEILDGENPPTSNLKRN